MRELFADLISPKEIGKLIEEDIQKQHFDKNKHHIMYRVDVFFDRTDNPFADIYKEED